jgi:hypothetical protein
VLDILSRADGVWRHARDEAKKLDGSREDREMLVRVAQDLREGLTRTGMSTVHCAGHLGRQIACSNRVEAMAKIIERFGS